MILQGPLQSINGIPDLERGGGREDCVEWCIFRAHQRRDTAVGLESPQEIKHLPKISCEACKIYAYEDLHTSVLSSSSIVRS